MQSPHPSILPAEPPGEPSDYEDTVSYLAALGIAPEKLEEIRRQLEQEEGVLSAAGPQGRQAGRVYMAANPLEHIGSVVQKYRAGRRAQALEAQQGQLTDESAEARRKFIEAFAKKFGALK